MQRVGNDKAGFTVDYDSGARTVSVVAWGFWTGPVAQSFAPTVLGVCRNAPSATQLSVDGSALKPQGDQGLAALVAVLTALPKLNLTLLVTSNNPLTKLQIVRLAQENNVKYLLQLL